MSQKCLNCNFFLKFSTLHYGKCDMITSMNDPPNNRINVSTHDDWGLHIDVGENFGCIHFKERKI